MVEPDISSALSYVYYRVLDFVNFEEELVVSLHLPGSMDDVGADIILDKLVGVLVNCSSQDITVIGWINILAFTSSFVRTCQVFEEQWSLSIVKGAYIRPWAILFCSAAVAAREIWVSTVVFAFVDAFCFALVGHQVDVCVLFIQLPALARLAWLVHPNYLAVGLKIWIWRRPDTQWGHIFTLDPVERSLDTAFFQPSMLLSMRV